MLPCLVSQYLADRSLANAKPKRDTALAPSFSVPSSNHRNVGFMELCSSCSLSAPRWLLWLFGSIAGQSRSPANLATPPQRTWRTIRILGRILMPLWAMSFALLRQAARGQSTAKVFLHRNGLKMIGVDAVPNAAQMIEGQPLGDGANTELVRPAMRANWTPATGLAAKSKTPVAMSILRCRPKPTGLGELDLRPETLCNSFRLMTQLSQCCKPTVPKPPSVMRVTPLPSCALFGTTRDSAVHAERLLPCPK